MRLGVPIFNVSYSAFSGNFRISAEVTDFAQLDDLGIFDSEEDGVTPQGVVYWVSPSGVGGVTIAMPDLATTAQARPYIGSAPVDQPTAYLWYLVSGMHETAFSPYTGGPVPATLRVANFKSTGVCSIQTAAQQGFWLKKSNGAEFLGLVQYPALQ